MIDSIIKKINRGLKKILDDTNRRYRLGLISDALFSCSRDFILRPGKRIRPLLFILAYKGYTKKQKASDENLFISAASIELLHDYMLIHDDVIDNSDIRRGKPTLHRLFDQKLKLKPSPETGKSLAIVAGDIIFALGIEAFLAINEEKNRKEQALRKFIETAAYTGAGEFIDVVFGHKDIEDISEKEIFLNYTLKTARYTFEGPLLAGAILAGARKSELDKISKLGLAAGRAFQIYDDFLDLFSTQKTIGKPILTDLAESKKTLLVFKAYRNLQGEKKRRLKKILDQKTKSLSDLSSFRRLILESGSYDYCLKKMTLLQDEAATACQSLTIKKPIQKILGSLIDKLSPTSMPLKLKP